MKTILCTLLLLLFSAVAASAVTLDGELTKITLGSDELLVYLDADNSKNLEGLLDRGDRFFTRGNRNSFPYSNTSVWTKVTLHNRTDSRQSLYLINDFVAHDEVDLYLIKNNEVIGEYFFGDTRERSSTEVLNRFVNVRFELERNEALDVVIRYHSTTPISIKLKLLNAREYAKLAINDLTIWGIFIGITLALASYNIMMFLSLKNIAFLFYVLHSLANLYNTLTSSGHVYMLLSPMVSFTFLNLSYKVMPSLAIIFMSLFIIHFFELKNRIKWLYKLNLFNACLFGTLIGSLYFFYISDNLMIHNQLSARLLPLALVIMIFSAIVIFSKRLFAGGYFLLGAGIFFSSMLIYVLYFTGLVDFDSWIVYSLPFGMGAEAILFSMALGQKVKRIEAERLENALLVEESNKFNSTSYLLAGILHQFKQPLIYLGTEVLTLKTERFKSGQSDPVTDGILDHMEHHIAGMNDLVGNFHSFYSQTTELIEFKLEAAVDKVLSLLDSSLKAYHVNIVKECCHDRIHTDEKAFTQTLLIILENAVSVLKERNTDQPTISISASVDSNIRINIRDNAGGIAPEDLDKIFNIHYSRKESTGLGIGLPLARKLVENKLKGTLTVSNDPRGACFTLTFG